MSFRNTFVTDFIYQADDETRPANEKVKQVILELADHLHHEVDDRGFGFYAGIMRTHSGTVGELVEYGIEGWVSKLCKATKVPFRLAIMLESGPVITYNIEPQE